MLGDQSLGDATRHRAAARVAGTHEQDRQTGEPANHALVEHNLLAFVAYRAGKKLDWDAKNLKATNSPEADEYIRKQYRDGWILNG